MPEKNPQESISENLLLVWKSLTGAMGDLFSLTAIEARLARRSLRRILGFFLMMALLITTGWFFLMTALASYLFLLGLGLVWSLLCVVLLNIFLMFGVLLLIKTNRRNLTFPATRRQFRTALNSKSKTA